MKTKLAILGGCVLACLSSQAREVTDSTLFRSDASGNVTDLLRGKISGVRVSAIDGNPVGAQNVNIRGINSLRSDNQPLWIVDGVMVGANLSDNLDAFWQYGERSYTAPLNPLAFLNALEIESIEVLKDISSTAIYGSKGANGVILVKTRTAKKDPRIIDWTSSLAVNTGMNKTSLSHNHHLAIGGSSKNTVYNISGDFRNINGVLPNNNSNYANLYGYYETKANKVVWFGFNTILSMGKSSSPTGTAWLGAPSYTLSLRDATLSAGISPESWLSDYDDNTEDYRGLFSTFLTLNLLKNLSVTARGGLDFQDNRRVIWYGLGTDLGAISPDNVSGGAAAVLSSMMLSYNGNLDVKYQRYFGKKHNLTALLGGEVTGSADKFNAMNSKNFATHELRGKGLNLGNSPRNNHLTHLSYTHLGAYLNASYDYDKSAGLDLTLRCDATPKYSSINKDFYPSLSAYADVHRLFFKDFRTISKTRINLGYGWSGKEKYVPYDLFSNYLSSAWPVPEEGTTSFHDGLSRLLTKEFHAGIELGFFSDRLSFGLSYFDRITDDSFQMFNNGAYSEKSECWDWVTPVKIYDINSSIANRGYEFDLSGVILKTANLRWTASANLTYSANQLASSNLSDLYGKVVGHNIYCSCNAIDMPVSSLYGYKSDADGNYIDNTGEGYVSSADKLILGSSIPKIYGGLTTSLSCGPFKAEIQIDGAGGHYIANINNLVRDGALDSEGNTVLSSKYVEKGDFLRIGQIGLSYDIPIKVRWIKSLQTRFSCNNVAMITGYSGWNPDVNSFGRNSLSSGFDYGSYPFVRSFILSVSAKF